MKKTTPGLSVLVTVACCLLLLTKCQKEYSYEEKGAFGETALYTLSGAGGACLNTIVHGTYIVGIALDSSNTIEVELMVDSIGTYNISTNLVNGMQFSAKGSFVNAGAQTVILRGSGTPLADGTFSIQINGPNGCNTEVIVTSTTTAGIFYTLVGQPNDCAGFTVNGTYTSGVALTSSNTVQVQLNVLRAGPYSITTDTLDGIYFSASGSVSATGIQNITLAGSGTPLLARDLVFTTRGINTSCTFSLTVQNAAPVATYVLESGSGSPSPCIFTVNGTYKKDTVLASANSVKMNVFVTTVGNYTVATQTVNGITFAASGTFTATGAQQITLTGTGTPKATGTFTFTPKIVGPAPLGGAACAFTVDVM